MELRAVLCIIKTFLLFGYEIEKVYKLVTDNHIVQVNIERLRTYLFEIKYDKLMSYLISKSPQLHEQTCSSHGE